jgi:hypothetical protein
MKAFSVKFLLSLVLFAALAACSNPSGGGSGGTPSSAKEITGFSFETPSVSGSINPAGTILVLVPSDTVLTSLSPTITVSPGASVSPESGEEQDFSDPVPYTVTAEDSSTKVWTVTVQSALEDVSAIGSYLASASGGLSADDPVFLPVGIDLADTEGDGWEELLAAIETAEKYVSLDLSTSTMSGTEFDPQPGAADAGESKVISLTLPDSATIIKAGTSTATSAFKLFTGLKSVSGANVETIGAYAFSGRNTLVTAEFLKATTIGESAFQNCSTLVTADIPKAGTIGDNAFMSCYVLAAAAFPDATDIGDYAFQGCIALATANFPKAEDIGDNAFSRCSALETVDFSKATGIGASAFYRCYVLTAAEFPLATSIGTSAFRDCTALATADFPKATTIDATAFQSCTALVELNLPAATAIGNNAFQATRTNGGSTTALTVTLGTTTPPTLGMDLFANISGNSAKTVIIKAPAGAAGYGTSPEDTTTDNWGNAFRGKGWDGEDYLTGTVNQYITLTIETY